MRDILTLATVAQRGTLDAVAKNNLFRFRCDARFVERLGAVAALEKRTPSDLARIILEQYLDGVERRITGHLSDSHKPPPPPPEPPPTGPISYKKPRKPRK